MSTSDHSENVVRLTAAVILASDGAKPLAERDALKARLSEAVEDWGPPKPDRREEALMKIRQITRLVHMSPLEKVRVIDGLAWEGLR